MVEIMVLLQLPNGRKAYSANEIEPNKVFNFRFDLHKTECIASWAIINSPV